MREEDTVIPFSRNNQLTEHHTLSGFYDFTKNLNGEKLLSSVIYFGEWTTQRTVRYPEHEKEFFLYDIFNTHTGQYVSFAMVKDEAKRLGLTLVSIFYEGIYQSLEHLMSFMGRTDIGGRLGDKETGEGIVIKNSNYLTKSGKQKFLKLVIDEFKEVRLQNTAPSETPKEIFFVSQTVTRARIEKMLYKLVDEEVLVSDYGLEDKKIIIKHMIPRIIEDILKEESEMLPEDYNQKLLATSVGRAVALVVPELINNR